MESNNPHSRRDFLKVSTAGLAALTLGELVLAPQTVPALGYVNKDAINPKIDNTRVVYIHDDAMTKGTGTVDLWADQNAAVNDAVVASDIDKMARALAEESDSVAAWRKIFLKPASKNWSDVVVAIKTNNIAEQHTRNAVMKKLCEVFVDVLGVTAANVHIYDACHGGTMDSTTPWQGLPSGVKIEKTWGGFATTIAVPAPYGKNTTCVASLANGTVDILLNVALCKGHNGSYGRFTGCMKNHFGTCNPNPSGHGTFDYVLGINKTPAILGEMDPNTGRLLFPRQQLCFVDALWASDPGPGGYPTARPNRLFMGTFAPVVDYLVAKRFRSETMEWSINARATDRCLSEFGYTERDLLNGGRMIDAAAWVPSGVQK